MRLEAFTLNYPPHRYIGAELMTHGLLKAIQARGHEVLVHALDSPTSHTFDGIQVLGEDRDEWHIDADIVLAHAGLSWQGVEHRQRTGTPLALICHNSGDGVRDDLRGARADLVIVNSETMRAELGGDIVVHPIAPRTVPLRGDRVTAMSLNKLKGGTQFWRLARRMPDVGFLGVRSGYGKQIVHRLPNVEIIDHVPHDRLDSEVWARTSVFLQLSSSESWGMAAGEALAHGIPIVAHPTPGLREHLGGSAAWVRRDDTDELEVQVRAALARTDTSSLHFGALGRWIESETQVNELINRLERLADERLRNRVA